MLASRRLAPIQVGVEKTRVGEAALFAGITLITVLFLPSGALASGCVVVTPFNFGGIVVTPQGSKSLVPTPSSFVSITNTVNTAFLTNTTSFVSAPPNPQPGQGSGGVWARTIGGFTNSTAESKTEVGPFALGIGPATGATKCAQTNHQEYAGVQVGADIGKLNLGNSGANLHFGITGGFLGAKMEDTSLGGDLQSRFEVPFVGLYSAVTQGNFFADVQVRWIFIRARRLARRLHLGAGGRTPRFRHR